MRTKGLAIVLLCACLAGQPAPAAEGIKEALQKGLYEEEANRNLDSAIAAYQSILSQFADQRQMAATAVFRLGECYRKQGKNQEAIIQYQRILKEFDDQTVLANLSQANLTALGVTAPVARGLAALASAIEATEIQRIKSMIQNSPDLINARNSSGSAPLHEAAGKGQIAVATFLLGNKAEVNNQTKYGDTPLHSATLGGHKAMVELLLANGANIAAKNSSGYTPLHYAAEKGFRAVAAALIEAKGDVNAPLGDAGPTPLHLAAQEEQTAIIELLLDHGAKINALTDYTKDTPLVMAVRKGKYQAADLLLARGADPNIAGQANKTPLLLAVEYSDQREVESLLRRKANPNVEDAENQTPLLAAIGRGSLGIAQLLLANGADPNREGLARVLTPMISNHGVLAPLQFAVATRNREVAKLLLQHKADVSIAYENGSTLLHSAVRFGDKAMVELLLANKANPNTVTKDGETPLSLARRRIEQAKSGQLPPPTKPPPGAIFPGQPSPTTNEQEAKTLLEIADLLLKHGADPFLQRRSVIAISRKPTKYSEDVFRKDKGGHNRYSLLELIAWKYSSSGWSPPFPNLATISISRLAGTDKVQEIQVNLNALLKAGEYNKIPGLEWGDVVEIPEEDHLVAANWQGFEKDVVDAMSKATIRQAQVIAGNQTKRFDLIIRKSGIATRSAISPPQPFPVLPTQQSQKPNQDTSLPAMYLSEAVALSHMVRTSSDVSRVVVKRKEAGTGKLLELPFDLSKPLGNDDLWLRDGDVIVIPDKQ